MNVGLVISLKNFMFKFKAEIVKYKILVSHTYAHINTYVCKCVSV